MNFKNPEGQLARWLEVLSTYSMKVEHRPGRSHGNADGLSRKPCSQCGLIDTDKEHGAEQCSNVSCLRQENKVDEHGDLKRLQSEDGDIAVVRDWVSAGKRPEFKEILAGSYVLKSLWNQFPCLELQGNLLVRRWEDQESGETSYQTVVPRLTRRTVLKACHDMKTAGHLGVRKTISKLRQRFYWPGLQSDVRSYVSGCETCMKRKGPTTTKRAPMQIVRSGYPMERLAIDILGELPKTERGMKYILVISDYFTKWTEALPMPNMEAVTVAKILVEEVISRFGVPKTIHSDQGRQFESNLFKEMCKILEIEKTRTTPYHPQSDGMVERFNRTLAAMLSSYVSNNQKDWDEQLPYVMMAYRSAEHETTGMSPNMLMFGREVSTPVDLMFELPSPVKPIPSNQWVWELRDRIESAHTLVRKNTEHAMNRQKQIHDSRTSYERFRVGEQVLVYFPVKKIGTSSKLTSFWRGPYQITGKLSEVLYKVNCGLNRSDQVIHCDRIRVCKNQTLRGETGLAPEYETSGDVNIGDADVGDDSISETMITPEAVDGTDSDDIVLDTKRTRRKPVWSKDYVFACTVCDQAFKKRTYLTKHKLKQHEAETSEVQCILSSSKAVQTDTTKGFETKEGGKQGKEQRKAHETGEKIVEAIDLSRPEQYLRQVEIKCSRRDEGSLSKREIEMLECDVQVYKSTSSTRKTKGPMKVRLDDLLPDGNIKSSNVELWLTEDSDVCLKFEYQPEEFE